MEKRNRILAFVIVALILVGIIGLFLVIEFTSKEGKAAPDFTLTDTYGNRIKLSEQRGKVVLLDFMAIYCQPCKEEMGELKEVYKRYNESEFILISISVDRNDLGKLEGYKKENADNWTFCVDETGSVSSSYGITSIPRLFVIDKNGIIQFDHTGTIDSSILISEIEKARNTTSSSENEQDMSSNSNIILFSMTFAIGMMSFFSPCNFPMLPSYITYYLSRDENNSECENCKKSENKEDKKEQKLKRAGLRGAAFGSVTALGFFAVFLALGIPISLASTEIMNYLPWLTIVVGVSLIIVGSLMLADVNLSISVPVKAPMKKSALSFFIFGLGYALASTGCVLPLFIMVTMMALSSGGFAVALIVFLVYATGMGLVMVIVSVLVATSKELIIDKLQKFMPHVKKISAIILIAAGLFMVLERYIPSAW